MRPCTLSLKRLCGFTSSAASSRPVPLLSVWFGLCSKSLRSQAEYETFSHLHPPFPFLTSVMMHTNSRKNSLLLYRHNKRSFCTGGRMTRCAKTFGTVPNPVPIVPETYTKPEFLTRYGLIKHKILIDVLVCFLHDRHLSQWITKILYCTVHRHCDHARRQLPCRGFHPISPGVSQGASVAGHVSPATVA